MSEISDYDRAISAYQFQVDRYHTWMNYYSLFQGALLVALYSVGNRECYNQELTFLPLIICFVGFIAGLCWLGTVIGNRHWINKWLNIIQLIEVNQKDSFRIYSRSNENPNKEKGLLSTQKIMRFFTCLVSFAWILVAAIFCGSLYWVPFIIAFVIILIAMWIYYCNCPCIHSEMK